MNMRNLILLFKLQVNAQYGISTAIRQWKAEKKVPWKSLGLALVIDPDFWHPACHVFPVHVQCL